MKITRGGNPWEPWQEKLAGFLLPWWISVAPLLARALWLPLLGSKMPPQLATLLDLWPLWVFAGAVLAMATLSSDFRERTTAQRMARWYLLGTCVLPVLVALVFP